MSVTQLIGQRPPAAERARDCPLRVIVQIGKFSTLPRSNPRFGPVFPAVAAAHRPVSAGTNVALSLCMSNGAAGIYWHRQLPPLDAEVMGDHVLEATSHKVRDSLACRTELWEGCYRTLVDNVETRLKQEILRLGGDYAHVRGESIDARHDDRTGEVWLHGRYDYALLRKR